MPLIESIYRGTQFYNEAYRELIHAARSHKLLTYRPFIDILKLRPGNYAQSQVGQLLAELGEDVHRAGFPILTAIIANQSTHLPGDGFFDLAQGLGKLPIGLDANGKKAFWDAEVGRVFETNWPLSATLLHKVSQEH